LHNVTMLWYRNFRKKNFHPPCPHIFAVCDRKHRNFFNGLSITATRSDLQPESNWDQLVSVSYQALHSAPTHDIITFL